MKNKTKFNLVLSLLFMLDLAIPGVYALEQAKPDSVFSTQSNVPTEISFTAQKTYKDPFNEVILDVVFIDPKGVMRKVPAFWAGGNVWKVRYSSPLTGAHRYWSECSFKSDAGLNEVKGAVNVSQCYYSGQ